MPERAVKYLGRHLMIKGTYIEKVLNNVKKATIRRGIVKPKYKEVIIHAGGRPIAKAKITRVYHKKLKELGEYEAQIEGYSSVEELLHELRRVYKDIKDDEYFTVIEFEIIQRFDELVNEDPYYGLAPADIARIALRYVNENLTDLEKRVLIDLTRTNSIRKTTINIFGNLNRRSIVRGTLRKALRILIERNFLRARVNNPYNNAKGEL